jgi:predicted ATP-binding protein involved in virulence
MERPLENTTPWYSVYRQLALQLHRFYKKNEDNTGQALFNLLNDSIIFKRHNYWLSNMTRIKAPSLDPIQLFASFSRSRQKEEIRIETINTVLKLLNPKERGWKKISFDGCPTPMALKLQYVRPEHVQRRIWETFNNIMNRERDCLTPILWDEVKTWRGIGIPSFTIFLFWINSIKFIPLDKNTRQYLERSQLLSSKLALTFDSYQVLLNNKQIKNYTNLALEAFYFNNDPELFKKKFQKGSLNLKVISLDTGFRLIGIQILNRNKKFHKILKPKTYYPFDKTIKPKDKISQKKIKHESFHFEPSNAQDIYDVENLKVSITAIVGKNGSGKSTLLDLLLMGFYNLSVQLGYLNRNENKLLANLNFEFYWHSDTLYKITFGDEIQVYRFQPQNDENNGTLYELENTLIPLDEIKDVLFYNILINYSHYALNSSEQSYDWITPLCYKNDGYLTPIVINPKRTEGNIDINTEKTLLNMRLLLNLLELHDPDIPNQSFRYLDNGKYLKYFSVGYNSKKNKEKTEEAKKKSYGDSKIIRIIMNQVKKVFILNENLSLNKSYNAGLDYYIGNKLLTIVNRYDRYRVRYKSALDRLIKHNIASTIEDKDHEFEDALINKITELLLYIKADTSHITLKFKQAVYFLKYPSLQKVLSDAVKSKTPIIELNNYMKIINTIINLEVEDELRVEELLPPSIFTLDFHFDDADKSSFSKASSGEYQLVSVLSSILYHLRNIDSIDEGNRYNYVTVLLDEIELYFHPNMQRFFIKKLLDALAKCENNFYGIHILFATHSPFILSDIQQQKILKLKNGIADLNENNYNTFASNIHDLLADEFFLEDGYMGAFAKKQIETAINILNYIRVENEINKFSKTNLPVNEINFLKQKLESELGVYKEKLESLNYWNNNRTPEKFDGKRLQKYLQHLIEIIGEPLIKENLENMFRTAFLNEAEDETIKRENAKSSIIRIMKENNITKNEL